VVSLKKDNHKEHKEHKDFWQFPLEFKLQLVTGGFLGYEAS
jgi:hypothetical protein